MANEETQRPAEQHADSAATSMVEVVRARRQLILRDAPCEYCGATLAACKANRGKDPTAPAWFGCCARGMAMDPCRHRYDPAALEELMREVELGEVRAVDEILAERAARAEARRARIAELTTPDGKTLLTAADMFGQGEWWQQKSGEWIRISEMSPGHRYNSAAMILRTALTHALRLAVQAARDAVMHDGGDVAQSSLDWIADDMEDRAVNDPQGVVRESALYRALITGLTIHGDGTRPWQATHRNPVTGEETEVPPPMVRSCELPACGCSGEAHA